MGVLDVAHIGAECCGAWNEMLHFGWNTLHFVEHFNRRAFAGIRRRDRAMTRVYLRWRRVSLTGRRTDGAIPESLEKCCERQGFFDHSMRRTANAEPTIVRQSLDRDMFVKSMVRKMKLKSAFPRSPDALQWCNGENEALGTVTGGGHELVVVETPVVIRCRSDDDSNSHGSPEWWDENEPHCRP
jgi:hypothetical protein